MKIAFLLYDGFSSYDFASLFEPLARLKSLNLLPELEWQLFAKTDTVHDEHGLPYKAAAFAQPLQDFDLLVVPGCSDPTAPLGDASLLQWLGGARSTPWLAAVGNGVVLLAAVGLLQGKRAACRTENCQQLAGYGAVPVEQPLVEDDAIFTASGSPAALRLAFSLCAQLAGLGAASLVSKYWEEETQPGVPADFSSDRPASSGEGLRYALVRRKTNETSIELELDLDGSGKHEISSGLPFLDHMLAQLCTHGLFDLKLTTRGDLQVDPHHSLEDTALALGEAFRQALGERRGIVRMASAACPMDDSLAWTAVDFSGRPYAVIQVEWGGSQLGGLPTSLVAHFLESFASQARCNLHARVLYGRDDHHKAEALFKALGRALDAAAQVDERRSGDVPSTKGMLF